MAIDKFRQADIILDKANSYVLDNHFGMEGDYNGRELLVQITNNGVVEDTTGLKLNLGWYNGKAKNNGLNSFTAVDTTQGLYKIRFDEAMMNTGNVTSTLQIIDDESVIYSRPFTIKIGDNPINIEAVITSDSFTALNEALLAVSSIKEIADAELNQFFTELTEYWQTYVDSVQDILSAVDPGGVVLNEVVNARKPIDEDPFTDLGTRLNSLDRKINDVFVNILDFEKYVVDGDWTEAFRAAAATKNKIVVPNENFEYKVSGSIELENSIEGINFPVIKMVGVTGGEESRMFLINNYDSSSLSVHGLHLKGEYAGEQNVGEQSHLIKIGVSKNIEVSRNILEAPFGDCVYVGTNTVPNNTQQSENIKIFDNQMLNPRRCCVAIVHAKNVEVTNNYLEDNYAYVATIDIEPNPTGFDVAENISIKNNTVKSSYYFVNMFNPNETIINNVEILNNTCEAAHLVRAATGNHNNLKITGNTFSGTGRMLLLSKLSNLIVSKNIDLSTTNSGSLISLCPNVKFSDNTIDAVRLVGVAFENCDNVQMINNTIKRVYSANGAIIIRSTDGSKGHRIDGNTIIGSDYGIVFTDAKVLDTLVTNNIIESARRGINIAAAANGSDISIPKSNRFSGDGTPVIGYDYLIKWDNPEVRKKGVGVYWLGNIPTSGNWIRGDIIYKINPFAGDYIGWVCVTDGKPGEWKPFGKIES